MRVLLAGAEAVPFAKVGGLADVLGSLPGALRQLGVDARVMLPGYGFINHLDYAIEPLFSFDFAHRLGTNEVQIYACQQAGTPFYFLQSPPYFGGEGDVYSHGNGGNWDMQRFVYFNQAAMAAIWRLQGAIGWFPQLLHVNDWHTSLLPFLVQANRAEPLWASLATALSIHNIAYQGDHAGGYLFQAGIDGRHHADLSAMGLSDNLLAIGIAYSDVLSTVSPRYAEEIQYAHAGYELAGLISQRSADLRGILNGLDTAVWDPATDPSLFQNFSIADFERKRPPNKRHLQTIAKLPVAPDVPLIGIVSRLVQQKGFDLALPALRQLLARRDLQLVALGTGDSDLEAVFWQLGEDFPDQVAAFLQFDSALAQQIYAGCDLFLMPSHFEPCGMGQMMALTYGALPLARETGGLADTVQNYDNDRAETGAGFVFQWQEASALLATLDWALDVYHHNQPAWRRMQRRGMSMDFSWQNSARAYIELYNLARGKLGASAQPPGA